MPTMDGRITMTCEPIFEEGVSITEWKTKPDPKWEYTDPAGHRFNHDNLKALTETLFEEYWDPDGYDEGRWVTECRECGAEINPGYIKDVPVYNIRNPDRYLGMKTTLTYQDEPGSNCYRDRTWIFRNDELTQRILDQGTLNPRDIEELGEPEIESWRQW